MLRPVGSRIPNPLTSSGLSNELPWDGRYETVLVDSGTSALSLAVKLAKDACGVSGAPEVIMPAYGCPDLVAAVIFQGAKPVLVDFEEERPVLCLSAVERAISSNTIAIIAVDFLGLPENLGRMKALIAGTAIRLIEDSAQGFPPASSRTADADYVVLSFGRGKPINLMGGGALLIRDAHAEAASRTLGQISQETVALDYKWRLKRQIFNLLLSRPLYGLLLRLPFLGLGKTEYIPLDSIRRLDMPAGLIMAGIRYFHERPNLESVYSERLESLFKDGWLGPLQMAAKLSTNEASSVSRPKLLRYPLLAPNQQLRDSAIDALNAAGIGANAFYGRPLPAIDGVQRFFGESQRDFPNACEFSGRLITLPLHEDVSLADIDRVAGILKRIPNKVS